MKRRLFIITLIITAALATASFAQESVMLAVGGQTFSEEELSLDQSGEGWKWSAGEETLTLDGYSGEHIASYLNKLTLVLVKGSANQVDDTGAFNGAVFCDGSLDISGAGTLTCLSGLRTREAMTVRDCALRITGSLYGENGVTVVDSNIDINKGALFAGLGGIVSLTDTELSVCDFTMGISAGQLDIAGGSVSIANCKTGVSCKPWNSLKGDITLDNARLRVEKCDIGVDQMDGGDPTGGVFKATGCDIKLTGLTNSALKSEMVSLKDSLVILTSETASSVVGDHETHNTQLEGDCKLTVRGMGNGFLKNVFITATDELDVMCVGSAIYDGSLYLPEARAVEVKGNRLIVKNGIVEENGYAVTKLIAGGVEKRLEAALSDVSGAGWSWSAKEQTFTLDGYDADSIELAGGPARFVARGRNCVSGTVKLSLGSVIEGEGELKVSQDLISDGIIVDGPSIVSPCVRLEELTLKSGSVKSAEPILGKLVIEGGKLLSGISIAATQNVVLKGGTIENIEAGGPMALSTSYGDVMITGGEFVFSTVPEADFGIRAQNGVVSIGGTAHVVVRGVTAGFSAKKVSIGGKKFTGTDGVEVLNGAIVKRFDDTIYRIALIIGDKELSAEELKTDISGANWKWEAKKRALTLDNATDYVITYAKDIVVRLAPGSVNNCYVHLMEGGTVSGPGKMTSKVGAVWSPKSITIEKGAVVEGYDVSASENLTVKDSDIKCTKMYAHQNMNIKNSTLHIEGQLMTYRGNVTIVNSLVITPKLQNHSDETANGEIYAEKKLTLKNSALVCGKPGARTFKRSGSIVFLNVDVPETGVVKVLLGSAAVSRSFEFPEGIWYIPKGMTLKTKGKGKLAFMGEMAVYGGLKGNITLNGEPVKKAAGESESKVERVSEFVDIS